jgi:SAM-dependent methyltransferase
MPQIRAPRSASSDGLEPLLAEQLAYYRAVAPTYGETAVPEVGETTLKAAAAELAAAIEEFGVAGDVLELACGPGTWTESLLPGATSLTAVDAAPEMLAVVRSRIADERVRFVQADIFDWTADRLYDCVFFGFWLSHVPLERFESFWAMVATALKPTGRVLFVDDGYRIEEELIDGPQSSTIHRALTDGTRYRILKVPHAPDALEAKLRGLGWDITVRSTSGPFYWGSGSLRKHQQFRGDHENLRGNVERER